MVQDQAIKAVVDLPACTSYLTSHKQHMLLVSRHRALCRLALPASYLEGAGAAVAHRQGTELRPTVMVTAVADMVPDRRLEDLVEVAR